MFLYETFNPFSFKVGENQSSNIFCNLAHQATPGTNGFQRGMKSEDSSKEWRDLVVDMKLSESLNCVQTISKRIHQIKGNIVPDLYATGHQDTLFRSCCR